MEWFTLKIMVTGGAGFIGSNLVDFLIETGNEVFVVDNLSTGSFDNINSRARFYEADINSDILLEKIFKETRPDIVFHLAAQANVSTSIKEPLNDEMINIRGTLNLLEKCKQFGVRKIIYSSSAAVYGKPMSNPIKEDHIIKPISFYGISKLTPEYYLEVFSSLYNIKYTVLRYANVYGPRQNYLGEGGVIPIFINKILNKESVTIYGSGRQTRDFIFVKDIVYANTLAINHGDNEIFNIGSKTSINLIELVDILAKITNNIPEIVYEIERPGDILHSCLDNTKALVNLGWEPRYSLEEGLEETISYYVTEKNKHMHYNI